MFTVWPAPTVRPPLAVSTPLKVGLLTTPMVIAEPLRVTAALLPPV
jgi:hypothetical protein